MVSVFPDPASVRRGAVEYLATPENIGWVAIGCVLLALAFLLGWILKGFAPRRKEITTAHIVRDVSPHKLMMCVSFLLPDAVCWADGDEGVAASAASASDSKRQRSE